MVKFLHLCFYAAFSIFSDRRSDHRSPKIMTRVPKVQFIDKEAYSCGLELPLTGTNFHGPEPVRATAVLL